MTGDARYTVRRLGWHQAPHGDAYTRRVPTAEPVAAFDTFDEAEYHRRVLELDARTGENPFRFGGAALFFQTSLDGPRLHDWLLDAGIDPPAEELRHRDWKDWWDAFAHTWTDEQLAHAWHGLDKVRFFDVAEERGTDSLWAVLDVGYVPVGATPAADREGGTVAGVYRAHRAAEAAHDRLNAERRQGPTFVANWWVRMGDRPGYAEGGRRRARRVGEGTYAEVLEIPGDVPRHAGVGFLVQRRAFDRDGYVCHGPDGQDTGARVPVRVFADRGTAAAFRDEMNAAAREVVNPFRVFRPPMAGLPVDDFLATVEALRPPLPWPPHATSDGWREWWDLCQDELTADQRAGAGALFADHPLFEVLEVEVWDG